MWCRRTSTLAIRPGREATATGSSGGASARRSSPVAAGGCPGGSTSMRWPSAPTCCGGGTTFVRSRRPGPSTMRWSGLSKPRPGTSATLRSSSRLPPTPFSGIWCERWSAPWSSSDRRRWRASWRAVHARRRGSRHLPGASTLFASTTELRRFAVDRSPRFCHTSVPGTEVCRFRDDESTGSAPGRGERLDTMKSMRFPVVLFDLDGTLIDSGPMIVASMKHAAVTVLAREIPEDVLASAVGGPGLVAQINPLDPSRADELVAAYRAHNEPLHDELEAFWEVVEVLPRLRAEGRRLGIVTAKRRATVQLAFDRLPG